jgi:DNA (cytosine-5)-methyltransferase 1
MSFIIPPRAFSIWHVLAQVVNGIGVAKQMTAGTYQDLFGYPEPIFPIFEYLRKLGYEVRNHNTNPQIQYGDYLIPYAFPTLTPRSIQLRKTLRAANE